MGCLQIQIKKDALSVNAQFKDSSWIWHENPEYDAYHFPHACEIGISQLTEKQGWDKIERLVLLIFYTKYEIFLMIYKTFSS